MKKWYQSKVVWFNILTGVLAIISLPDFISLLPVTTLPYISLVGSVGNYILRVYFTTKAIDPV